MRKWIVALTLFTACVNEPVNNDENILWITQKEFKCLADNVYYEARGEPLRGQIAVARVTLNRAEDKRTDVCSVVYAKYQFSWTLKKPKPIKDAKAYEVAKQAAWLAKDDSLPAYYFHNKHVKPLWRLAFTKLETIGNHIFYK